MEKEPFSLSTTGNTRVLLAPLDWGLGHATRCIPIINELLNQEIEVWIAANGAMLNLLQNELTNVNFLLLKGYQIHFSRKKSNFELKIILQLPKILLTYFREKGWMHRMQKRYRFSAIISDNRPGIRHPGVHSVYITHQLHIRTGHRISTWISNRLHRYIIRKFDTCWVPDAEVNGLAGELSHPPASRQVQYIGPLSRMQPKMASPGDQELLCVLSGPEPQRTALESLLTTLAIQHGIKTLIIRGLPGTEEKPPIEDQLIRFKSHLPAAQINEAFLASKFVICRSGYTTIMDLAKLRVPALLVPTPGQTEQEYLADFVSEKGYFQTCPQNDLQRVFSDYITNQDKATALPEYNFNRYKTAVANLVATLNERNIVQ